MQTDMDRLTWDTVVVIFLPNWPRTGWSCPVVASGETVFPDYQEEQPGKEQGDDLSPTDISEADSHETLATLSSRRPLIQPLAPLRGPPDLLPPLLAGAWRDERCKEGGLHDPPSKPGHHEGERGSCYQLQYGNRQKVQLSWENWDG